MKHFFKSGIPENIQTVRRIRLGRVGGVDVSMTVYAWLGPVIFFSLSFLASWINPLQPLSERLLQAINFTLAVALTTFIHAFGHIISGKLAHSPMDELLIASTRDVNLYHGDQSAIPSHVHLARALGGPVLNLIVVLVLVIISSETPSNFTSSLISVNLFFGLSSFLPIPSVDGEVIWREILQKR